MALDLLVGPRAIPPIEPTLAPHAQPAHLPQLKVEAGMIVDEELAEPFDTILYARRRPPLTIANTKAASLA